MTPAVCASSYLTDIGDEDEFDDEETAIGNDVFAQWGSFEGLVYRIIKGETTRNVRVLRKRSKYAVTKISCLQERSEKRDENKRDERSEKERETSTRREHRCPYVRF